MEGATNSEKCTCKATDSPGSSSTSSSENMLPSSSSSSKEKKRMSLTALSFNLKRGRSLQFKAKRSKKSCTESKSEVSIKKSHKWPLKFTSCTKRESKSVVTTVDDTNCCKCTCYRLTGENTLEGGAKTDMDNKQPSTSRAIVEGSMHVSLDRTESSSSSSEAAVVQISTPPEPAPEQIEVIQQQQVQPIIREINISSGSNCIYGCNRAPIPHAFFDLQLVRGAHEDCDEAARRQRAKEIEQGVEPPANFKALRRVQLLCPDMDAEPGNAPRHLQIMYPSNISVESLRALFQNHVTLRSCTLDAVPCHTQIDFIHCLVPDLLHISNCSFYWGKMDRYEAEKLLDGKPEGTFLLRDSAQEEFLFSVSFRRYGRSLHARIEQWNHKFSFDSHDPGVFTSETVCGLIEHHKDPSSCMFFEPMLTWPLHRNFTFSLQHLCRAAITSRITYDDVNQLQLPKTLKSYLKEYHYRQKVRVKRFDDDVQWLDFRNMSN